MAASTAVTLINIAIPLAEAALKSIAAANAGNVEEARRHLADARQVFDAGSKAWDDAGEPI